MKKELTIADLATLTSSEVLGDPNFVISGVNDLESAMAHEASFCDNLRYEKMGEASNAGVIFISRQASKVPGKNYLITSAPSLAFQKALLFFMPKVESGFTAIHPTAAIHPDAIIGSHVTIGPHAVIDARAQIGQNTVIGAGCFVGAESILGESCILHPKVIIRENCCLGKGVIIQSGAVIGSCGFGYYTDSKGKHHHLEQLGKVILEDDVEIGANTTIDRARFKETIIGKGTKIDNLVQIAHGVSVGKDCLIVSQVGIAGSSKIGNNCILAGQVGVVGHISIGSSIVLTARSAASKSIAKPGIYAGAPAIPLKEHHENLAFGRNIKKLAEKIKKLEEKVTESENATS